MRRVRFDFWKYCKEIFENDNTTLPSFDKDACFDFFRAQYKANNRSRDFNIPSWMSVLKDPIQSFNTSAPSYQEISNIIRKMKVGSSACPFDQISKIILKRCPFLRTVLHRIIVHCWERKVVPTVWKHGLTILIYKKGSSLDPANYRPITLQPVFGKIFTSIIRNRIYSFLMDNDYVETKIQKGFWNGISGTIEHTELLTHIINHARTNKRHLIVTLLDLKNAFGEVDHQLLTTVLEYHRVPTDVVSLIQSLYSDYTMSVGTNSFITDPILDGKGVLQGDCLSPLLFNMCINTLIKCIEDERVQCIGYSYCDYLRPRHWFQFADDTALITASEEDNQALLNVFAKWCQWAGFNVRVEKCSTFGIKHNGKKAVQFQPFLKIK